jgi:hypothetical protein
MAIIDMLNAALAGVYRIEREVGAGGMATVYLARDMKHERDVALKLLRDDLSASIGAGRFLREIKIAAQLQHPHILPLLDSGEAGGHLYFVMPYVKGQSLRERLARDGELPVHEAVRLLTEIVDALAEAHSHGVVHRDIKPDNVMLSGRHALVTDFGVAKAISEATGRNTITTLGIAVGTPTYMSPEQAVADPHVDHRSDIYSVGIVAYEMLTGQPPFVGGSPQQVLAAQVTVVPDRVSKHRAAVPAAFDQIVTRCLEKRPSDRFQTATELLAALEPLATPSTGMTPAELPPAMVRGRRPSWVLPAIGTAAVAALLLGGIAYARRGASGTARTTAIDRVQLTTSGRARAPLLSPDGKSVVYTERSCAADTLPCQQHLVMQDVGTGARQSASDTVVAIRATRWSATGAWILVHVANTGATEYPQKYVMSHLGGVRVPMGYIATFTPTGDTVVSVHDVVLHGARTVTARSFAAPWTQATDSVLLIVPERAVLLNDFAISQDRRWLAASWDIAGQRSGVLTIHDQRGRVVATRTTRSGTPLGTWSGSALVRPMAASGQGGVERIAVDARTGALGGTDTLMLGASSGRPAITVSADGVLLALDELHGGETSLSTLESGNSVQPFRIGRRLLTDPALSEGIIAPDGATIVYGVTVVAGASRRTQLLAMPFVGGEARPITAPLADLVDFEVSADSRRVTVATGDGSTGTDIVSYDLASGREVARARHPAKILGLFSTSAGPGISLERAIVFLDSTLAEKKRVALSDSLGSTNKVTSSSVLPAAAVLLQPLDLGSTFRSDWNFHFQVLIADTSGRLTRGAEITEWNSYGEWWLADGSFRMLATLGTDPIPAIYRVSGSGGAPQRIGIAPFHDRLNMSLAADGRRGVVVTRPDVTDVWLIRNFGALVRR